MYRNGHGVTQDYAEAMKWYRKAAEQGDSHAQCMLAYMHYEGHGAPQDYTEAMKWYRKAAEQGDANAQYNLAYMYANGQGVPLDYEEAYFWVNLAAVVGNRDYVARRNLFAEKLSPQDILAAQKRAREWKPISSASQGDR
jgi:hypothetical protein